MPLTFEEQLTFDMALVHNWPPLMWAPLPSAPFASPL